MPLVGGDLCPIAIDVVEKFQIVGDDPKSTDEPEAGEPAEEFETELHYVDQKEEGPTEAEMHRTSPTEAKKLVSLKPKCTALAQLKPRS